MFLGPGVYGEFEFGGCGWGLIVLVSFFSLRMRRVGSSARVVATRSVRVVVSDWCHYRYKRGTSDIGECARACNA